MKTLRKITDTYTTRIDLPAETREAMVRMLNQHLADSFDLYSQTKYAHWNVKGPQFYQLHELFDELAGKLTEWIDLVAERATALGGTATGTVRMSAKASRLPEFSSASFDSLPTVEALAAGFASLARSTRTAVDESASRGDMTTSDLFTEISRGLDKSLWLLEAHLQA